MGKATSALPEGRNRADGRNRRPMKLITRDELREKLDRGDD